MGQQGNYISREAEGRGEMKRFEYGQRIVTTEDAPCGAGKKGTVVRLLIRSSAEAWVNMDDPLDDDVRLFNRGDIRKKHVLLRLDQCETA